jgi:hypothetical protein
MHPASPQRLAASLPVCRASELPLQPADQRWLIQGLWAREGVGLIGGNPKLGKSWLGLEMAVSVSSATPCLGRFEPAARGPALLYMAEDAIPDVRARLEALCRHHGVDLEAVDIFVITAPSLSIDRAADQQRLKATVASIRPHLLLLDPLVRLHQADENSSADMSALLGFLRQLQRELHTAVALVHHARKNGASGQLGQALRGSSDLHAFGDSNLYLTRKRERLTLTIEHRAAPSPEPLEIALIPDPIPHLEIVDTSSGAETALREEILEALHTQSSPVTRAWIRRRLRVKNQRLGLALQSLEANGTIERTPQGWRVASGATAPDVTGAAGQPLSVPVPPSREQNGNDHRRKGASA